MTITILLNGIKQTLVKLANLVNGKIFGTKANKSNNNFYDREVLLIGKNQNSLKDLKSIILQLNHNCICAETIEQAEIYLDSTRLRLIALDFDKSICSTSFSDLELFCKIPIIVFVNRETVQKIKSKSILIAQQSYYSNRTIFVEKSISVEQAFNLFSEYLCGDATPIIKWD